MRELKVFGMKTVTVNGFNLHVIKILFNNTMDNVDIITKGLDTKLNVVPDKLRGGSRDIVNISFTSRGKICLSVATTDYSEYSTACKIVNTISKQIKLNNIELEYQNKPTI